MSRRSGVLVASLALIAAGACGGGTKPLKGAFLVTDLSNDTRTAVNALGLKPEKPLASADILGVRLDADGTTLRIRIALADTPANHIPNDPKEGPDWFVQLWAGAKTTGAPAYFIAIVRDGVVRTDGPQLLGWRLSVCPGTQVCTKATPGTRLAIIASEVRAEIPLRVISNAGNPFSWVALSYWNSKPDPAGAWSDYVPDASRPAPGATTYPAPGSRALFPARAKSS